MFRIVVIQLCLAVLGASVDAQTFHVHLDEHSPHFTSMHGPGSVNHMHWEASGRRDGFSRHTSVLDRGDGGTDAVFLNGFHQQATAKQWVFVPEVMSSVLIPMEHPPTPVVAPAPQSHDPPWLEYSGSRAPPSIPL